MKKYTFRVVIEAETPEDADDYMERVYDSQPRFAKETLVEYQRQD